MGQTLARLKPAIVEHDEHMRNILKNVTLGIGGAAQVPRVLNVKSSDELQVTKLCTSCSRILRPKSTLADELQAFGQRLATQWRQALGQTLGELDDQA